MRTRGIVAAAVATVLLTMGALFASAATPENLFGSTIPAVQADADAQALTVGLRFSTKAAGQITGVRFFKGSTNTGTHVGAVYSSTGAQLAKATFTGETATGWQSVTFAAPLSAASGASFTAAVLTPRGHYAVANPYGWPRQSASLTGTAGVYRYGSALTYPTSVYGTSNYFVDVSFTPSDVPSPSPSPTVTPTPSPSPSPTPTVTPSVTPSPSPSPTPSPSVTPFPDATNTGVPAGTVLTAYAGPMTITTAGTVIDSKQVNGQLTVRADNVIIRNSRVTSNGYYGVLGYGKNLTLEDSTFNGSPGTANIAATGSGNLNAARLNVSGGDDGVRLASDSSLTGSYVHDLSTRSGAHNDAVTADGFQRVTISGNTILNQNSQTAAIWVGDPRYGPSNVTVINNLIGGGGYTIYGGPGTNTVKDNQFTTRYFPRSGSYGLVAYWTSQSGVWSGNTWADGPSAGLPANP